MSPVVFTFVEVHLRDSGEVVLAMVPQERYRKVAARQFATGEEYPLVVLEARSRSSHNHFFAAIHEGYQSLPESIAARWPTEDHLRRWALVQTGWFSESEIDCASPKHATQAAVLIRSFDEYARISVHGAKVIIRRAKSQSAAAMGKDAFEQSKKAVLELIAELVGVKPADLNKNAGRSA